VSSRNPLTTNLLKNNCYLRLDVRSNAGPELRWLSFELISRDDDVSFDVNSRCRSSITSTRFDHLPRENRTYAQTHPIAIVNLIDTTVDVICTVVLGQGRLSTTEKNYEQSTPIRPTLTNQDTSKIYFLCEQVLRFI
jgi:hypothetical protein